MNKLEDFGLSEVEKQPYQITKWEADEWNLTVNGEEVPCFYTPNTGFTKEDGIQTEIVYLGDGEPEDFEEVDVEGKIVLMETRFPMFEKELLKQLAFKVYDPDETLEKFQHPATYIFDNWWKAYRMACENNAAGIVSVLTDYPTNENRLQIPYYGPLNEELPEIVPELFEIPRNMPGWIPGLWVGKDDGAKLIEEVKENDGTAKANLTLTGETKKTKTHNIFALLHGQTEDTITIHCHHDAPWKGAVEDGSGVSEVLALAEYLINTSKEDREKTYCFLFTGTHFGGPARGAEEFIENNPEIMSNHVLEICIEHIAKDFDVKDDEWADTGLPEPRVIFTQGKNEESTELLSNKLYEEIEEQNLTRTMIMPGNTPLGVPTDANAFARKGYSVYSYISGPEFLFDPCDTMDKVATEQLNTVAKTFAKTIQKLDKTQLEK